MAMRSITRNMLTDRLQVVARTGDDESNASFAVFFDRAMLLPLTLLALMSISVNAQCMRAQMAVDR